jgi:hypothetical protein
LLFHLDALFCVVGRQFLEENGEEEGFRLAKSLDVVGFPTELLVATQAEAEAIGGNGGSFLRRFLAEVGP